MHLQCKYLHFLIPSDKGLLFIIEVGLTTQKPYVKVTEISKVAYNNPILVLN